MVNRKALLASAFAVIGTSAALACAIDLPNQLLADRPATFRETVPNSFAFEVSKLAGKADDTLKPKDEGGSYSYDTVTHVVQRSKELLDELSVGLKPEEAELLRKHPAAEGLPKAVQLYEAGAAAFHNGEKDKARSQFQAILDLPQDQRAIRAVYAQYMLARLDDAGYEKVRALALSGLPDPSGLAVASYGDEARLHLRAARKMLDDAALPPEKAKPYAAEITRAIDLYAEQAAHGAPSGASSLRMVAQHILADESTVTAAIEQLKPRRLLVGFILARFQSDIGDAENGVDADGDGVQPARMIEILADVSRRPGMELPDRDLLANLAYREGKYDLAEALATKAEGPLAAWIKAKLALQKGDVKAATAYYAEAIHALPTDGATSPLQPDVRRRLEGESGALALGRGDYVEAMRHLWNGGDWRDTAYVAERVLTVDELRRFVDETVKPAANPEKSGFWGDTENVVPPAARLRDLLARRLVREGRVEDALPYFTDKDTRQKAADYNASKRDVAHAWRDSSRAEALYRTAVLEREAGLEIMGSEEDPDFMLWNGELDGGVQTDEDALSQDYVTDGERQRYRDSKIQPDIRFHYRYLAVDDAVKAADLLPPRSQAFAAVLCDAAYWMLQSHEEAKAWAIYQRYVKEGPAVAWAAHFGRDCPEPEFSRAKWTSWQMRWKAARHALHGLTGHGKG